MQIQSVKASEEDFRRFPFIKIKNYILYTEFQQTISSSSCLTMYLTEAETYMLT